MKIQLHILIIILTLGFFLSPTLSYACGTKTEKSCCKKETTSKTEKKTVAKTSNHKSKTIVVAENVDIQTAHHLQ